MFNLDFSTIHATFKQNSVILSVDTNLKLLYKEASELLTLFNYEETVSEILLRQKVGDIFIFKSTAGRKDEWKAGGQT